VTILGLPGFITILTLMVIIWAVIVVFLIVEFIKDKIKERKR